MSSKKKIILITIGVVFVLLGLVVVAAVVIAPKAARSMVEERLARVEARTGLDVTFDRLEIEGLGEVTIGGLKVLHGSDEWVRVKTIRAEIDPIAVLYGSRRVQQLEVSGVTVTVEVARDGSLPILDVLRSPGPTDEPAEATGGGGLARRLDAMPVGVFSDVAVEFKVAEGGPKLPIQRVQLPASSWTWDGESLSTSASIRMTSADERVELPQQMDVAVVFDETLKPVSGDIKFDGVISVTGVDPLPFVKMELGGLGIDAQGGAFVSDVRVMAGAQDVASLKALRFGLGTLTDLKSLKFASVTLDEPVLHVAYDLRGASALGDIVAAVRPAAPRMVAASARRVAGAYAQSKTAMPVDEDEAAPAPLVESDEDHPISLWLARLPGEMKIRGAAVDVHDPRPSMVVRPAKNLNMRDGEFSIAIEPEAGHIKVSGGFKASAEGAERGKAAVDLTIQPVARTIAGDVDFDEIDLSWASQMLGTRASGMVRGGTLRAKAAFEAKGPGSFDVDGVVSVSDLVFFEPRLAEEPLTDVDAAYTFSASYDSKLPMPAAKLLKTGIYPDPQPGSPALEPPAGGLVFHKGVAEVGDVRMTFRPSIYGFNAPGRLPARLDLQLELAKTPAMSLFKAVPAALMGATAGTQLSGYFEWKFAAEIPLYRAGDMEWQADPKLTDFEVVSIPDEVDVRTLMDAKSITIVDSIEEEDDFTRTIRIGAAAPYPVDWMLANTGLTIEQIDERRRKSGWPPLPTREDGVREDVIDSAEVWSTQWALRQQAAKPWQDGDEIQPTKNWPYGPYVYVPIQYISPYMVRAVVTTEDNSFFLHSGFNTLALKESIERNLSAGSFKRGASTIAMQMVKNVFLNRKKVISRKLQEAFLVFLMESVVDVPKTRIMEVYLNVIEFGPGIFGIHEAAVHYFGKRPDALTLGEVAWLVSIIPGPKKFHTYWERGAITPQYFTRMKRYVQAMYNRGRITEEELNEALLTIPEFYKPEPDAPLLRPVEAELLPDDLMPPPLLLDPNSPPPNPPIDSAGTKF